jgi:hypothetical protein
LLHLPWLQGTGDEAARWLDEDEDPGLYSDIGYPIESAAAGGWVASDNNTTTTAGSIDAGIAQERVAAGVELTADNLYAMLTMLRIAGPAHMLTLKSLCHMHAHTSSSHHWSVQSSPVPAGGHLEVVRLLWEHQDQLHPHAARAALCRAAEGGHLPVMTFLLTNVRGISKPGRGDNPLSAAARGGHMQAVRLMLLQGADPENRRRKPFSGDAYSTPPLEAAAQGGSLEVLQLVRDLVKRWERGQWFAALSAAAGRGDREAVLLLLSRDPRYQDEEEEEEQGEGEEQEAAERARYDTWSGSETEDEHADYHPSWYVSDDEYESDTGEYKANDKRKVIGPVAQAAAGGHIQIMELLLRRRMVYWNAFEEAVKHHQLEALQLLLYHGGQQSLSCLMSKCDRVVRVAIQHNKPEVIQWLLEMTGHKPGAHAVLQAVDQADASCLAVLLQHGARDDRNKALFTASHKGRIEALGLLLGALPPAERLEAADVARRKRPPWMMSSPVEQSFLQLIEDVTAAAEAELAVEAAMAEAMAAAAMAMAAAGSVAVAGC